MRQSQNRPTRTASEDVNDDPNDFFLKQIARDWCTGRLVGYGRTVHFEMPVNGRVLKWRFWGRSASSILADTICNKYSGDDAKSQSFRAMAKELDIKCKSYSILNKAAFWLAVVSSIGLIVWPVLVAFFWEKMAADNAAILQTAITAAIAAGGVFYTAYKSKQTRAEGLLRLVAYSDDDYGDIEKTVRETMEKVDMGFDFTSFQKKLKDQQRSTTAKKENEQR